MKRGISIAKGMGMDTTITINKPATVSLTAMATLVIAAIAAKVRATIDAQVPEGYEDESGFHFGSQNLKH